MPEWQRSYAWDSAQVESFWTDLTSFNDLYPGNNIEGQEYFLGSIVLVTGGPSNVLLDGQQRLATATILLSALRDARRPYKADAATRLQSKYISDFDDATNSTTYVLSLNVYDRDFFRTQIQSDLTATERPQQQLKSHGLIRRAREYFDARIAEACESLGGGAAAFEWNLRIGKVLTDHMSVVTVTSSDEDNAASVFETLNDRGIGLSTPDLLRNLLLRRAPNSVAREGIVAAWQQVLSIEDEVGVDRLLRHYWVSIRGDVKTRSLYREIKATITAEQLDSLSFSKELAGAASAYRDLVQSSVDDVELKKSLDAVRDLGATVLYPALLSAHTVGGDSPEKVRMLASALVTLFVRYNVIAGRETTTLESVVYGVAKQLREDENFEAALAKLVDLSPDAEDFARRFARAVVARGATARYILEQIEHSMRATEELSVAGSGRVHVEHIYPQTPLADQRLANHASIINRLGNLTLLSRRLNTSIRNSDFPTKKAAAYEQSEIAMTRKLVDYDHWDAATIAARQLDLTRLAPQIWALPDEEPIAPVKPSEQVNSTDELAPSELPEVPAS